MTTPEFLGLLLTLFGGLILAIVVVLVTLGIAGWATRRPAPLGGPATEGVDESVEPAEPARAAAEPGRGAGGAAPAVVLTKSRPDVAPSEPTVVALRLRGADVGPTVLVDAPAPAAAGLAAERAQAGVEPAVVLSKAREGTKECAEVAPAEPTVAVPRPAVESTVSVAAVGPARRDVAPSEPTVSVPQQLGAPDEQAATVALPADAAPTVATPIAAAPNTPTAAAPTIATPAAPNTAAAADAAPTVAVPRLAAPPEKPGRNVDADVTGAVLADARAAADRAAETGHSRPSAGTHHPHPAEADDPRAAEPVDVG